jgi:hypothetical protein
MGAGGMSYLDLAVGPDRNAAIAVVTGVGAPRPRSGVLALTRTSDGGRTWTEPTVITHPDEEEAIEPHVFFDRTAALRVEWVQQAVGSFVGGSVWQTMLSGMDRHATSRIALPSDVMTSHSEAALDSCGTLHVLTIAYPQEGTELRYARWTADGWTAWTRPFDGRGGRASIVGSGSLIHVVWNVSASPASSNGVQRFGLAHSALPIVGPEDSRR